jgi:hypothetical protein
MYYFLQLDDNSSFSIAARDASAVESYLNEGRALRVRNNWDSEVHEVVQFPASTTGRIFVNGEPAAGVEQVMEYFNGDQNLRPKVEWRTEESTSPLFV